MFGLDEAIEAVQKAISDFGSGQRVNIAIMALPFAGKSKLLDEIVKIHPHEVTKITFSSIISNREELPLLEETNKIMVFDNCHYLYMRKIGGFDVLEEFLKMVISSDDRLYITTWNIHSWNYLDRVMDIGKYFPVQLIIPQMDQEDLKKFLLSEYEQGEIQFVNDTEVREDKIFTIVKRPVAEKSIHSRINIYSLKINKILFEMFHQNLIAKHADHYSVKPEKLHVVIKYLENIRLVW